MFDSNATLGSRPDRLLAEAEIVRVTLDIEQSVWLAGTAVRLPREVQSAAELNKAVGRPAGWLERRAGILQRRVWGAEDPLDAAADCAAEALRNARLPA